MQELDASGAHSGPTAEPPVGRDPPPGVLGGSPCLPMRASNAAAVLCSPPAAGVVAATAASRLRGRPGCAPEVTVASYSGAIILPPLRPSSGIFLVRRWWHTRKGLLPPSRAYGDDIGTTGILAEGDRNGLIARGGSTGSGVVAVAGREGNALADAPTLIIPSPLTRPLRPASSPALHDRSIVLRRSPRGLAS